MIPQDESQENEFERAENLVDIHMPHSNRDLTLISKRYQLTINEEEEDVGYKKPDFLQANPILPPDKHTIREEPAFRLKFMNQREKFNKTSFTQIAVNTFNRKSKLSSLLVNGTSKNKDKILNSPEEMDENQQQDPELKGMLEHKIIVYRRYNFNRYNTLGKEKVLCSLFLQHRKEQHSSKTQPIYEYLTKINNAKHTKVNNDSWLTFNSSFQSGNALMVVLDPRLVMPTYEVYMQNDVNTRGCTQWFYFSVENKSKGKANFCLTNFYKPTSLYQRGMKVLCSQDGIEWKRTGTAITYSKSSQQKNTYGLSFIHDFDQPNKTTYFAYGYPYTYSHHFSSYIQNIFSDQRFLKIVHKTNLCYSAMGNPIPILTITGACTSSKKQIKQLIYIIGRQHPGETPASFIVQGLISLLLSSTQEAKDLRQRFQFKIVPMVNVDGVISGNYRSNISGSDVNRQWQFPSKRSHPQINAIKQQIGNNRKQVAFFLDIHAHSRKMNSFFYGSKASNRESKLYPFVCSKLNKFISYNESSFTDDPSKKTTARVILETESQIPHSLTFQVSFYGYHDTIKGNNYSFKQVDLRMIGQSLGLGFYYFFIGIDKVKKNEEIKSNALPKCISEKEKNLYKNSLKMLQKWSKQLQKQNQLDEVYSQGSQIDPQHFQLKQEERQFISQLTEKSAILGAEEENSKRCVSTPKEQKYRNSKKIIYSSLTPELNDSKLLTPKRESKQYLGISSDQFYHFSQSKKDKKFSVKQLELQLQLSSQPSVAEQKLKGMRFKMGKPVTIDQQILLESSFRSERQKNYKEDILEMKKALKYLLQSKSSDYNEYKSCFKSFTNEMMSTTLRQHRRVNKL